MAEVRPEKQTIRVQASKIRKDFCMEKQVIVLLCQKTR